MKIKNNNYEKELDSYNKKIWDLNLIYVNKEVEYAYGNMFQQYNKAEIWKIFTSKEHLSIKGWQMPRDENDEIINPYRAYNRRKKHFMVQNLVFFFIFIFCLLSTLPFLLIVNRAFILSPKESTILSETYWIILLLTLIFLWVITFLAVVASFIYNGIRLKHAVKKWHEVLEKNGIIEPQRYFIK